MHIFLLCTTVLYSIDFSQKTHYISACCWNLNKKLAVCSRLNLEKTDIFVYYSGQSVSAKDRRTKQSYFRHRLPRWKKWNMTKPLFILMPFWCPVSWQNNKALKHEGSVLGELLPIGDTKRSRVTVPWNGCGTFSQSVRLFGAVGQSKEKLRKTANTVSQGESGEGFWHTVVHLTCLHSLTVEKSKQVQTH